MILLQILAFIVGALIVLRTLASAIVTFVMPRSARDQVTRIVFLCVRRVFDLRNLRSRTYEDRDRVLALYAPIGLLMLPIVWLSLVLLGYMCIFWALGAGDWGASFKLSGSSLLTLGFSSVDGLPMTALSFSEAAIGLILVALLISYLPTMYNAFARRETAVTMLEVRAGSPPSAVEMFARAQRIHGWERLPGLWVTWEAWFADLEESHTSLAALAFFRSPQPGRSWITAAGAVLDSAALANSTLDIPHDPQADFCIRAGYLALRYIADFFGIEYDPAPKPDSPISITRGEFDAACEQLAAANVPLKPDREKAWRDFVGWRVNYDTVLLALAALTAAPYAPWISDRGIFRPTPPLRGRKPKRP